MKNEGLSVSSGFCKLLEHNSSNNLRRRLNISPAELYKLRGLRKGTSAETVGSPSRQGEGRVLLKALCNATEVSEQSLAFRSKFFNRKDRKRLSVQESKFLPRRNTDSLANFYAGSEAKQSFASESQAQSLTKFSKTSIALFKGNSMSELEFKQLNFNDFFRASVNHKRPKKSSDEIKSVSSSSSLILQGKYNLSNFHPDATNNQVLFAPTIKQTLDYFKKPSGPAKPERVFYRRIAMSQVRPTFLRHDLHSSRRFIQIIENLLEEPKLCPETYVGYFELINYFPAADAKRKSPLELFLSRVKFDLDHDEEPDFRKELLSPLSRLSLMRRINE